MVIVYYFFFSFPFLAPSLQCIPRMVWLDSNGRQLVQWPVEELESIREKQVDLVDKVLGKEDPLEITGITAAQVSAPPFVL